MCLGTAVNAFWAHPALCFIGEHRLRDRTIQRELPRFGRSPEDPLHKSVQPNVSSDAGGPLATVLFISRLHCVSYFPRGMLV